MTFHQAHHYCSVIHFVIAFCITLAEVIGGLSDCNAVLAQETTLGISTRVQRILHSINDADDRSILIAAHRGGYTNDRKDGASENSVANVAVAVGKGYEVFETDIQRTADGVFVIVHDATLERETDGAGTVAEKTLEQLLQLHKRYRDGTLSDHRIATLAELLDAGNGQILFKADLKPGVIDYFDELARLIAEHPAAEQVLLRTMFRDADTVERCFAGGTPKVEIMFKVKNASQVKKAHKRFAPKTIQVDIAKKADSLSETEEEAIRTARALGILVETHAYKSPQQTAALLDAGVRMLHTNNPKAIRKAIAAHKTNARPSAQ